MCHKYISYIQKYSESIGVAGPSSIHRTLLEASGAGRKILGERISDEEYER